ncbi:GTPase IMAP family member 7-like [Pseudorasbora parva]|uniref:GTPase IMAP family member 7-like n=1 Tax=Pseudorasbora parva TaxID=51549 RepID=UPI00351E8A84
MAAARSYFLPGFRHQLNDLRIVLVGKNVSENSRVRNIILGTEVFDSKAQSHLQLHSVRVSGEVEKRHITVINNPHLLQPHLLQHQITQGVRECLSLSDPGPHAIILVLQSKDFREEDRQRVKAVLNLFSEKAIKHTIVLTTDEETRAAKLASRVMDKAVGSNFKWASMITNSTITNLIKECGGGHLKFDSRNAGWRSVMFRSIEKILKEENEEFLICNRYEDGGDGSSVDEDLSRSGGSIRGHDKEDDIKFYQSTKTGSDEGGLSKYL